jgi:hypothetical protein
MDEVAAALARDEAGVAQDAQVLGDGARGDAQPASEGVDAEGAALEEPEDAGARAVREDLEPSDRLTCAVRHRFSFR